MVTGEEKNVFDLSLKRLAFDQQGAVTDKIREFATLSKFFVSLLIFVSATLLKPIRLDCSFVVSPTKDFSYNLHCLLFTRLNVNIYEARKIQDIVMQNVKHKYFKRRAEFKL